jgi:hypothetical protein
VTKGVLSAPRSLAVAALLEEQWHERKSGGNYASLAEEAEKTWDRKDPRWNQHPPQSYLQMLAARGAPRTSGGATVATASARDADNSVLNKRQKIDADFDLAAYNLLPYWKETV